MSEKSKIVKNAIRESTELSVSEEFLVEFEKKVDSMLKEAEKRARSNNRRTLYSRDL